MKRLFLRQLYDHLHTLRFQLSLLVLVLFFAGNGVVYSWRLERLHREIAQVNADINQRLDGVETVRDAAKNWYTCLNHPLSTEFIHEGGVDWFHDLARFSPQTGWGTPGPGKALATNHWMEPFEIVDWTFLVRIILSFLCVVLAYDAISGEREAGTLHLVMANSVSRGQVLASKFLAPLVILLLVTFLSSLVSLLILSLNGVLHFAPRLFQGYGMFLVGSTFYMALFLFLSVGISALVRSSTSALVLLLLIWAVLTVIIPQASYLVGARWVETSGLAPEQELREKRNRVMEGANERVVQEGIWPRNQTAGQVDDYAVEKRYVQVMRETEQEMDRVARFLNRQMLVQYRLVKTMNLLSPGFAFQYTVEAFLGTGDLRTEHFFQQVWEYREMLRDFLRTRDKSDPNSPQVLFLPEFMSAQSLEPNQIPHFRSEPLSLGEGVMRGIRPITILLLECFLSFFFAFWAFYRSDIAN